MFEMRNDGTQRGKKASSQQKIAKDASPTEYDPTYGLFEGLKQRVPSSISEARARHKRQQQVYSTVGDSERAGVRALSKESTQKVSTAQMLSDGAGTPIRSARESRPPPNLRLGSPANITNDELHRENAIHSASAQVQKPRGPRLTVEDRGKVTSEEDPQSPQTQQSTAETTGRRALEDGHVTRGSVTTAGEPGSIVATSCHDRGHSDHGHPKLLSKKTASTARAAREQQDSRNDELFQVNESERRSNRSRQNDEGINTAEEISIKAFSVEVDATMNDPAATELMRTKSMLRGFNGLTAIWSRAGETLQKIPALYDLGVCQRVMEMMFHVLTTLHHASPAIVVLRSKNARAGEYGKAMRDFSRAVVYLLVLLSLLQLVVQAARVTVNVLAALAWPVKLVWTISRWVCIG